MSISAEKSSKMTLKDDLSQNFPWSLVMLNSRLNTFKHKLTYISGSQKFKIRLRH